MYSSHTQSERSFAAVTVTQTVMQSACKRRKISSRGTKKMLSARLAEISVRTTADVRLVALEFESKGPNEAAKPNGKQKLSS